MESHDVTPHIVVSEQWALDLSKEFGFDANITKNEPFGRKLNKGITCVLRKEWDWLVTSGSDDFTEPSLFTEYAPHFETQQAFGLNTITMVRADGLQKEVSNPYPFGGMRCLRRDVVEGVAYVYGEFQGLWTYHSNRGMDYDSQKRIEARGYKIQTVQTKTRLFDFKSGYNLNGFDSMAGTVGNWLMPVELQNLIG